MALRSLFVVVALVMLGIPSGARADESVTIFAAASTKSVIDAITPVLADQGIVLKAVFAGSSTLARQIEQGAPADLFLSANIPWMDDLTAQNLIVSDSLRTVASNRLVLITTARSDGGDDQVASQTLDAAFPLAARLQGDRLAIANPDHVPAGRYAREALTNLNLWSSVKDRLAPTRDVTSALLMVARGQTRLGIVYASDLTRTDRVIQVARFPRQSHSPIRYPGAIISGRDRPAVRAVLAFLSGVQGQAAFRAAGFTALGTAPGGTP